MEEDIETCGWFVFYKDQLLIEKKNGMYTIPFGTEPPFHADCDHAQYHDH